MFYWSDLITAGVLVQSLLLDCNLSGRQFPNSSIVAFKLQNERHCKKCREKVLGLGVCYYWNCHNFRILELHHWKKQINSAVFSFENDVRKNKDSWTREWKVLRLRRSIENMASISVILSRFENMTEGGDGFKDSFRVKWGCLTPKKINSETNPMYEILFYHNIACYSKSLGFCSEGI